MSDIGKEILKTIEKEKITPKSKLYFFLKNLLIWTFLALIFILSSLVVSIILFISFTNDWDASHDLDRGFLEHFFICIPYFWLASLALLILAACYIFIKTKHGYRHTILKVLEISVIIGLFLGIILFFCGINPKIHESFSERLPFYDNLTYYKEDIWGSPQNGLLGGKITEVLNENEFIIEDFKGNIWHLIADKAVLPDNFIIKEGLEIKTLGTCNCNNNIFYVKSIHK